MNPELGTLWEEILETSKAEIPKPIWESLLKNGLFPYKMEQNTLTLFPIYSYIPNLLTTRADIISLLQGIARRITKNDHLSIMVATEESAATPLSVVSPAPTPSVSTTSKINSQSNAEPLSPYNDPVSLDSHNPLEKVSIPTPSPDPIIDPFPEDDPRHIMTDLDFGGSNQSVTPSELHTNFSTPQNVYDDPVLITVDNRNPTTSSATRPTSVAPDFEVYDHESLLNPSYTFENFITGNSNRLAVAAAKNVVSNPSSSYNPLFIYGGSGLGKTHLMHAIGHEIKRKDPSRRVLCISSEKFMNDLIASIEYRGRDAFRDLYRKVDVLLIDDIQFIQNKKATKDEFFHTFNTLHTVNKQIVLTSDVLPSDMTELEDRLRTRFESGFVASIEPPDLETRIAILRARTKEQQMMNPKLIVEDAAITFIASNVTDNIRSLEGTFKTIINTAIIQEEPVTEDFAYNYVKTNTSKAVSRQMTIELIQEAVSDYFHIKLGDLVGKSRNRSYAHPRQVAMYLCRHKLNLSFPSIAEAFQKKDHTTAMHAYNKIDRDLSNDEKIRQHVEEILKLLRTKCE